MEEAGKGGVTLRGKVLSFLKGGKVWVGLRCNRLLKSEGGGRTAGRTETVKTERLVGVGRERQSEQHLCAEGYGRKRLLPIWRKFCYVLSNETP